MLGVAAVVAVTGCTGASSVSVVDDPGLEAGFDSVLTDGRSRTLGEITATAGIPSWDRMYYFRVPLLRSDLDRMLGTAGTSWDGLPGADAEGVMVFVSGDEVVHAVVDREPALYLNGFATSDSTVTPDSLAGIPRVAVESMGR